MGLKLLDTGKLIIDESLLSTASATLQTRLNSGIRIGFDTVSSTDLTTQIGNMLDSGGVIQDRFEREQKTQSALVTKKTALQEKLVAVQARYYSQYAALDALLYKLNSTSDSLKSALDGLTSSQNNG
jgi:flagellar hook-associated protein 2